MDLLPRQDRALPPYIPRKSGLERGKVRRFESCQVRFFLFNPIDFYKALYSSFVNRIMLNRANLTHEEMEFMFKGGLNKLKDKAKEKIGEKKDEIKQKKDEKVEEFNKKKDEKIEELQEKKDEKIEEIQGLPDSMKESAIDKVKEKVEEKLPGNKEEE